MSLNFPLNLEFLWLKKNRLSWQIEILLKRRSYDLIVRNPFRKAFSFGYQFLSFFAQLQFSAYMRKEKLKKVHSIIQWILLFNILYVIYYVHLNSRKHILCTRI